MACPIFTVGQPLHKERVMNKSFFMIACLAISTHVYADTCPSVADLKTNKAKLWRAFDSDNGKPLPPAREARLKKEIVNFALAEWSHANNKSMMHCYYKNSDGSHIEEYFAKESISPKNNSKYWYPVTGMMQCAAGADQCQFQTPAIKHQLAQNESDKQSG
jgi:hypothetical protein